MSKFSIIIPIYIPSSNIQHLDKYLKPCVDSIRKFSSPDKYELIIVSNGSCSMVVGYLASLNYSNVSFYHTKNPLGFAKAINIGLSIAKYENIILLNDDTVLLEQPVDFWLDCLESPTTDGRTVITGPSLNYFMGLKFIIGFCLLVKKSFIDKYGKLDEEFSPGWGEDIDLCLRAKQHGFFIKQVGHNTHVHNDLVVGSFPIYHKGEATFNTRPDFVELGRNLHKKMEQRVLSGYYGNIS